MLKWDTLSMFYKRWLIRDGRQYFENFRRLGLAFLTKVRDVMPVNFKKFKICEHTIFFLRDQSYTNEIMLFCQKSYQSKVYH